MPLRLALLLAALAAPTSALAAHAGRPPGARVPASRAYPALGQRVAQARAAAWRWEARAGWPRRPRTRRADDYASPQALRRVARGLESLAESARAAALRPSPAAARPAPAPTPASAAGAPEGVSSIAVVATAYCLTGTTATGAAAGPGSIAVDPAVVPLGSRLLIPGYGAGVADDTGSAIQGARIDVWLPCGAAVEWGARTVTISVE